MSTIYTQHYPEDFGAGSGLVWLGDSYTYEQAQAAWPNVKWSYLYSGFTELGSASDYSMIRVSGAMSEFWNSHSGMYTTDNGCRWTTEFAGTGIHGWYLYRSDVFEDIPEEEIHGVYLYPKNATFSFEAGIPSSGQSITHDSALFPNHRMLVIEWNGLSGSKFGIAADLAYGESGDMRFTTTSNFAYAIYYSGWAVAESIEDIEQAQNFNPLLNGFYLTIPATDYTGLAGVIETRHTYSGALEDAYRDWTQDEAAIQEAYERTVATLYASSSSISGVHWRGSIGAPPLFTINPGFYHTSYGHIWWHTTCDVDARGAKFYVGRKSTSFNAGTSPVWRTPTGNEAKAALTIGKCELVQSVSLGKSAQVHQDCEIQMPHIMPYDYGYSTGDYHLYDGCGVRFLSMYNDRIRGINIAGPFRYAVINSPDAGAGSSYNRLSFRKVYNALVLFKFMLRANSDNASWLNNSIWEDGQVMQTTYSGTNTWNAEVHPTVMFDADDSIENPNRDPADDIFLTQDEIYSGQKQWGGNSPQLWFENFGTETSPIVRFFQVSGVQGWEFRRGRFENTSSLIYNPATGKYIKPASFMSGPIRDIRFVENISQEAINCVPQRLIGSGVSFEQNSISIAGYPHYGKYVEGLWHSGKSRTTKHVAYDLYFNQPEARLIMPNASREKIRALYIDDIVDPTTNVTYPVAKVMEIPSVWMKWRVSGVVGDYTNEPITAPVGSTIFFKFGNFGTIPTEVRSADYAYIRPYIRFTDASTNETITVPIIPVGANEHINSFWYMKPDSPDQNDNYNYIQKGSYAECYYTFTTSGLIKPEIWMADTTGTSRDDYVYVDNNDYEYRITISG